MGRVRLGCRWWGVGETKCLGEGRVIFYTISSLIGAFDLNAIGPLIGIRIFKFFNS